MNLFDHYNFNELVEISGIDGAWPSFKDIDLWQTHSMLNYVRIICPRRYPWPKWFNLEIKHHLNKVHTLSCRYRSKPSPNLLSQL